MTKNHWAKKEQNVTVVHVNPATWEPIINAYYTPWARHVYDTKQTKLLAPSRQHHTRTWQPLGVSTQSIHSTLSTAFALKQYANYADGTGIRPTRQTLEHSRGYTENGTDGIDAPLHRLQTYGFLLDYDDRTTVNGTVPIYRLTIPAQLPNELPEQWADGTITGQLKTAITTINNALADERRRRQAKHDLSTAP